MRGHFSACNARYRTDIETMECPRVRGILKSKEVRKNEAANTAARFKRPKTVVRVAPFGAPAHSPCQWKRPLFIDPAESCFRHSSERPRSDLSPSTRGDFRFPHRKRFTPVDPPPTPVHLNNAANNASRCIGRVSRAHRRCRRRNGRNYIFIKMMVGRGRGGRGWKGGDRTEGAEVWLGDEKGEPLCGGAPVCERVLARAGYLR